MPASSQACWAAATASRTFRSIRLASFGGTRSPGSKPRTSAAIRTGYSEASNASIQPTPLRPETAASHVDGASRPSGVTAPRPVIATLRIGRSLSASALDTTTGSAPSLVLTGGARGSQGARSPCALTVRTGPRHGKARPRGRYGSAWAARAGAASRSSAPRASIARSRSRRWRRSSSASCPPATSGSTSRSGTASAGCSRTPRGELAALVTERAAAPPLLPRARAARRRPPAALGDRRRDRDRPGRRPRLRRDADPAASGGEPRAQALGRDPGPLHRLRPPRVGRRRALAGAARGAPRRRSRRSAPT